MSHRKLDDLVSISDRLLAPDGCPWDREQTHQTLRPFVLEEAHEVVEAIDGGQSEDLREELGDLLFQVVFLSNLSKRGWGGGTFDIGDVIEAISTKLIRRHPHVFKPEEVQVSGSGEVLRNWEQIKMEEKKAKRESVLEGVPAALPGLARAQRLTEKAARVGFDWTGTAQVLEKLDEEMGELRRELEAPAPSQDRIEDELGDLLFVIVNLARHLSLNAEDALRRANGKFTRRFQAMEKTAKERGTPLSGLDADQLDALWNGAKADVG